MLNIRISSHDKDQTETIKQKLEETNSTDLQYAKNDDIETVRQKKKCVGGRTVTGNEGNCHKLLAG